MPRQNTLTGPQLKQLKQLWLADIGDYVNDVAFSPNGQKLVAAGANGTVACLDRTTGASIRSWKAHALGTLSARWSTDGAYLATAGQDGKVTIVDGQTLHPLYVLDHGSNWVEHLAWAAKENLLLTAAGKILRLWDSAGKLMDEFEPHESTISGIQWNPAAVDIFASACYGVVRFWRIGHKQPRRKLKWKGSLLNVEYAPNGKVIACGCQDGAVHFWLLPNGDDLEMSGYPTKVRELAWHHDSRFLATGGGAEVIVWDFSGKGPEGTKPTMLSGHESFVSCLAYQPKGSFLASAGFDGRIFSGTHRHLRSLWHTPSSTRKSARYRGMLMALFWHLGKRAASAALAYSLMPMLYRSWSRPH